MRLRLAQAALCAALAAAAPPPDAPPGRALFEGGEALVGRIRGHADPMPPAVLACGNCHALGGLAAAPGLPPLGRASLLQRRARRNGPVSAYDQAAFCRVVRTGVDPVYVLLDRAMPLYALSDAQCGALWRYVTDGDATPG